MSTLPRDWRDPWLVIATGFGSGWLPRAPGTWGSLLGAALFWFVPDDPARELGAIVVVIALGTYATHRVMARFGVGAAGALVIDEVAGIWLALAAAPREWLWWLIAFGLFRVLDIVKPPPVRTVERNLPGAIGVMADDVVGGLITALVLLAAVAILPV
jgi:phosphatidylglycerophosphatase A